MFKRLVESLVDSQAVRSIVERPDLFKSPGDVLRHGNQDCRNDSTEQPCLSICDLWYLRHCQCRVCFILINCISFYSSKESVSFGKSVTCQSEQPAKDP